MATFNLHRFKYTKDRKERSLTNGQEKTKASGTGTSAPAKDFTSSDSSQEVKLKSKKRKFSLSSEDDEDSVKIIQHRRKTRITHYLTPNTGNDVSAGSIKIKSNNFISANSGSESDHDSQENGTSCKEGKLASKESHDSFDSPIVFRRKKNCMRLDSGEKTDSNGTASLCNDDKRSARRLGLSSSESESDQETGSNTRPTGPFPRLSCIVSNDSIENCIDDAKTVHNSDSETKESSPSSSPIVIKRKHKETKKPSRDGGSTMDNDMDENFLDEEDDYASSDEEFSGMSEKRKNAILDFFRKAGVEELTTMHNCSKKKAGIIIELRPFKVWDDLVAKLEKTKHLGIDAIHTCADLLKERKILDKLLFQCRAISNNLTSEIEKLHCHDHMTEGNGLIKAPSTIPTHLQLKAYQLVGLNWMALLHRNRVNGILADEMGLGKTVQTISFLALLKEWNPDGAPHLIIVPSSTLDNWCREFSLWCPNMDVLVYRGSPTERKILRVEFSRGRRADVIVTTYNSAISSVEDKVFFRKLTLNYAVFDEGHMLKNMSTQRYVNLMKINASKKLLLTGTPLQNNLLELMSLLRFVMPHMFEETTETLVRIFSTSNSETDFAKDRIKDAKDIMQPFVLRRLKCEVLKQLPSKTSDVILCELTKGQTELYDETKEKFRLKLNKRSQFELKNVFVELRKVANHPLLRRCNYTADMLLSMAKLLKKDPEYYESSVHLMVEDMMVMTDFELDRFCRKTNAIRKYALEESKILNSGKFRTLDKLLPRFEREGSRVVIFSQFTMVMDILEVYLTRRNHKFVRLDGSTPVDIRLDLIDKYQSDSSVLVFLASTKAGGLGVNLTAANVVILHDIDMNPYNDKQAEDRCHRLGQTKDVQIIRLISKHTLEEGMLQMAENKLKLEQEMTSNEDDSDIAALLRKTLVA